MRKEGLLAAGLIVAFVGHAGAAVDKEAWRKIFDNPRTRAATAHYLAPRPELEKQLRAQESKNGEIPKDYFVRGELSLRQRGEAIQCMWRRHCTREGQW